MKDEMASFYRLYYVIGGEAFYQSATTQFQFESNHLYILPSYDTYSMWHNPDLPFRVIYFHVELHPDIVDDVIKIDINPRPLLKSLLETLNQLSENKNTNEIEVVIEILLRTIQNEIGFKTVNDDRLIQVVEYIHRNVNQNINTTTLAQVACLERTYFSKKFKESYGKSPFEYVTSYRMNLAVKLLMNKNSVVNTACSIGYKDEKAFIRAFKKIYGVAPAHYIKTHKLQP